MNGFLPLYFSFWPILTSKVICPRLGTYFPPPELQVRSTSPPTVGRRSMPLPSVSILPQQRWSSFGAHTISRSPQTEVWSKRIPSQVGRLGVVRVLAGQFVPCPVASSPGLGNTPLQRRLRSHTVSVSAHSPQVHGPRGHFCQHPLVAINTWN